MKAALVHDWLTGMRGGEKVLETFCAQFPDAPIFTLVHRPGTVSPAISAHRIHPSFIDRLPGAHKSYQRYLPLFPAAIEQHDLRGFDLVLSSSHCVAKGVVVHPGTRHLCYCHTPMRYVWSAYEDYFGGGRAKAPLRWVLPFLTQYLRNWDTVTAQRVDSFAANSNHVRKRIERYYDRSARVIYPPADVDYYTLPADTNSAAEPRTELSNEPHNETQNVTQGGSEAEYPTDFYLVVSALVPYKRVDLVLEAIRRRPRPVVVIGDGVERRALEAAASGDVQFIGWQPRSVLREYYRRARALLFPGEEDFGIVPVEAQATGTPVIGWGVGGLLETVRADVSGVFYRDATADALAQAMAKFESATWDRTAIRRGVLRFGPERFAAEIGAWIREEGQSGAESSPPSHFDMAGAIR